MKRIIVLLSLIFIACKPDGRVIELPQGQPIPATGVRLPSTADLTQMITTYHSLSVSWRVVCTEANPNGIVIIERAADESFGIDKKQCLLDEYLTNYIQCYLYKGDRRRAIQMLSIAQAAVIVSYERKEYDVTSYTAEVETKAQSFRGRQRGYKLNAKIETIGWK